MCSRRQGLNLISSTCCFCGHLEWRKRYFILKGTKLFFAKTAMLPPHGMIDLAECVAIRVSLFLSVLFVPFITLG